MSVDFMKILHKLLLGMALPASLIWGVGLYATNASKQSLREAIERTSAASAGAVMDEIDRVMHNRITQWVSHVRSPLVQEALTASNLEFEQLPDAQRYLDEQDQAWRAAPDQSATPLMNELLDNELSRDLRARLATLTHDNGKAIFAEVFLTNRYGANVAQSGRTCSRPYWIFTTSSGFSTRARRTSPRAKPIG
jgi:hypothetical protein